jgi:HEAT repeat protein
MAKRLSITIGILLAVAIALILVLFPDGRNALMVSFESQVSYQGKSKDEWIQLLKDPKKRTRATMDLAYDRADGTTPVPILIVALTNDDPEVRAQGAEILASCGKRAEDAIPALQNALKDKSPDVRAKAAEALGKTGPKAKDTIPDLVKLLEDWDAPLVCRGAAAGLAQFGPDAKDAVPALVKNLKAKDETIKTSAGEALLKIDHYRATKEGVKDVTIRIAGMTPFTP